MGLGKKNPFSLMTFQRQLSFFLGKTVQMIATMAMNMPALKDECRTTLIVVPAALLQQVSSLCTSYF